MNRIENTSPALQRLISLLAAGYFVRVQDSHVNGDVISLEHPSNWQRVKEKSLWLRADGSIFGIRELPDGNELSIEPADEEAFRKLVAATPKPTWWDRNHAPFHTITGWVLLGAIVFALVKMMDFVVSLIRS